MRSWELINCTLSVVVQTRWLNVAIFPPLRKWYQSETYEWGMNEIHMFHIWFIAQEKFQVILTVKMLRVKMKESYTYISKLIKNNQVIIKEVL